MTQLGVAVVGCGFQGGIHARNVARSARARLVACIDIDRDRADHLAGITGAERSGSRPEEVWASPDVDIVLVATTTHTHHELALEAARHGKHMLLEKPMAMTVGQCLEIERACSEAGIIAVMGYKFRFTDAVREARRAVPSPRVLVAQTLYDPTPQGANAWVDDPALSGGRLVSSLVHSVDLLRHLSGDEIIRVSATGASVTGTVEPDTTAATLLFRNGAIGSIVHGTAGASGLLSTWSFQVADSGTNATVHDHGRRLTLHRQEESDTIVIDPCGDPYEAGTAQLFEAVIDAVEGEVTAFPGPRDGTLSLLVARCIEQAIASGQAVSIPSL